MSERRHNEVDAIVSSLPAHRWSGEAAASLEAAIEAINEVVAAYSELTALEGASDAGDERRLAQWRAARAACARERRSLDPGDVRRLAEVRERYSRLARELVGQGRQLRPRMRRINVTGNAGSGKSTVSRLLAEALGVELHGLDDVVWQPGWQPTPREERNRRIAELTSRPSWVIDGVSGLVRDVADSVVFLDVRRHVALRRCARRNLPYLWRSRPGVPERCPEALVIPTLAKLVMRFDEDVRPMILSDAADSHTRFIHVRSDAELDRLLISVGASPVRAASKARVVPFLRRQVRSVFSLRVGRPVR